MGGERGLLSVPTPVSSLVSVVICSPSAQQRARFMDALRGRASVEFVSSLEELAQATRTNSKAIDVVVVPSQDASGEDSSRAIRAIAIERPRTAIVGYCRLGSQYSTDIRALAVAGVHHFVFLGIDDTGIAFRNVLDTARRKCAAEWVLDGLSGLVPPSLHPAVEAMLAKPDSVTSVRALANALGVNRKTLFNRCNRAEFLTPKELLIWVRLAFVAYLLETTGCTIERISIDLAFPSVTSLRNTMKRYTGRRASEIRREGGLTRVLGALADRVRFDRAPRDRLPLV